MVDGNTRRSLSAQAGTPERCDQGKHNSQRPSNHGGSTPACGRRACEILQSKTPSARTAGQPCTPSTRPTTRGGAPTPKCPSKQSLPYKSNPAGRKGDTPLAGDGKSASTAKELQRIREGDETFRTGDDVFYIIDGPQYYTTIPDSEDDEDVFICGECRKGERKGMPFLECDYCLRPYHEGCLKTKPVEGNPWQCPMCELGKPPPDSPPRCNLHMFLRTEGVIGVGRILRLSRSGKEEARVEVQDYQRPEQEGSQRSIARRLHFTSERKEFPAEHLITHVTVANDRDELEAADTEDVFLCETRYNSDLGVYERLHPHSEDEDDSGESEASMDESSSDDDESVFEDAQPAATQKKRRRKAAPARGGRKGTRQGGETWVQRQQEVELLSMLDPTAKADESPACAAQRLLTLSERPVCLPCRDVEKKKIRNFIEDALSAQPNTAAEVEAGRCSEVTKCLYIAGVPGTGKTACVMEVAQCLQQCPHTPAFRFVYVNALYLLTPAQFYSKLFESIKGYRVGAGAARIGLEEFFGSQKPGARTTVLVVDEIDMLLTRDQNVLYNLFSWPHQPTARMAVIGIANTLDLPHRLFPKIVSRMGSTRLAFGPYGKQQMFDIVKDRLRDLPGVIDDRAVDLVARRVATVSGDVRRTLALLRYAVVLWNAAPKPEKSVTMALASQALKAVFEATHMRAMEQLAPLEQVVLASLILEARFTAAAACELAAVACRTTTLLRMRTTKTPSAKGPSGTESQAAEETLPAGTLFMAVRRLDASRLVLVGRRSELWSQQLTLNVPVDDAMHVLQGSEKIAWVRSILGVAGDA